MLANAPWRKLEEHISDLRERVEVSIQASHELRKRYREELLAAAPGLPSRIRKPSQLLKELRRCRSHGGQVVDAHAFDDVLPFGVTHGAYGRERQPIC